MKSAILGYDTDFANSIPNPRAFILSIIPFFGWEIIRDECEIVRTTKTRCIIRHTVTTEEGNTAVFYEKAVISPRKSGDCSVGKPLAYTGFVFVNPA